MFCPLLTCSTTNTAREATVILVEHEAGVAAGFGTEVINSTTVISPGSGSLHYRVAALELP